MTALMLAATKGHVDVVKLLLGAGAKIDSTAQDGGEPSLGERTLGRGLKGFGKGFQFLRFRARRRVTEFI